MSAPPAASELVSEPNPFVYQYSIQRHSDGAIIGEVSTLPGVNLDDGMAAATPRNSITSASASTFEDDLERGLVSANQIACVIP